MPRNNSLDYLKTTFRYIAIILCLFSTFANQYNLSIDGVTYIDIADGYLRHDWISAINGGYGPLYSWILAFGMFILNPTAFWESTYIYLVNFLIYLFTIFCFEVFLNKLINFIKRTSHFPEKELIILSYSLFIFCSVKSIGFHLQTPDMLLSGLIYLTIALLLHFAQNTGTIISYILFGSILGLNYLAKEAMFPIAFVFLIISTFAFKNIKKKFIFLVTAFIGFTLISGPFIFALSKNRGVFAYCETAKLNYALNVNEMPPDCFNLSENRNNKPSLIKKISSKPLIYEYGETFNMSTFPLVYDNTYWYPGIKPYFDLKKQLKTLYFNIKTYFDFYLYEQGELIFGLLLLFYLNERKKIIFKNLAQNWILIIPSIFVLVMYSLVSVELRYVGVFILLLWIGLFLSTYTQESKKLLSSIVLTILVITALRTIPVISSNFYHIYKNLVLGKEANINWIIAENLRQKGIKEGDQIAMLWEGYSAYFARLSRVNVREDLWDPLDDFWRADLEIKSKIVKTFSEIGLKAVVAENIPSYALPHAIKAGWERIGQTEHHVYFLKK